MKRYIADNEEELRVFQECSRASLVLLAPGSTGQTFPLPNASFRIGRARDNTMRVLDKRVSRYHCQLTFADNAFIISDQDSTNGTYVNGVAIKQPTRLSQNDKIRIGNFTFMFTTGLNESDSI